MEFTKQELIEIYDAAVCELECAYRCSDLEDVDIAKEPPNYFDIDDPERVLRLQSIVLKISDVIESH